MDLRKPSVYLYLLDELDRSVYSDRVWYVDSASESATKARLYCAVEAEMGMMLQLVM